jgi:hypothetical protein
MDQRDPPTISISPLHKKEGFCVTKDDTVVTSKMGLNDVCALQEAHLILGLIDLQHHMPLVNGVLRSNGHYLE